MSKKRKIAKKAKKVTDKHKVELKDSPLITFREGVALLIQGSNAKDHENIKFLFPPTVLSVRIYDSYLELLKRGPLAIKGNPRMEIKGIIPFKGIIKLNVNEAPSFQIIFDPKYGWDKIPKFFEALDPRLDKMILKNNAEYEASLKRCFIGPYIMFSVIFKNNKEKFPDVIKVLKSQNFAKPPKNVNGEIMISEIKEKQLITEVKEFRGIKLPTYEIEAIEVLEDLIRKELNVVDFIEAGVVGIMVKNKHINGVGLAGRGLSALPEIIGNFKDLYLFDVQQNYLTALPESFGNLKRMKECFLDDNRLENLPKSIGGLESLKLLGLQKNKLSSLPDEIGQLKELEMLILQENELNSLPKSIGDLPLLRMLGLRYNKLTKLPEEIGNLKSLQGLDLRDNQLTHLPNSIGKLTNLTHLHIEDNQLTELPESILNLTSLKELNLRRNKLTSLPEPLKKWILDLKEKGCEVQE
ncbi:MAG: leucine-rich repeat domain-containing protein [Candidatus Helarchaeota archaeon]|nr:leucine-rich repeat domain-containing protein [Candidatus Helarchaeota archaeon]